MSLAKLKKKSTSHNFKEDWDQIKIASKYPVITKKYFAEKGINVNCIKINGAAELAPRLGLSDNIVDLVSSGKTLVANGLVETEKIADISSRLVVNRSAFKTRTQRVNEIISRFQEVLNG